MSPAASAATPACTITYTGAYQPDPLGWEQAGNWSPAREPGPSDYACIPAGFTGGVVDVGDGSKVGGVSVLDDAGLRLHNFGLELTDPATPSVINNVDVSSLATFTIDQGVTLHLTGRQGSAGLTDIGSAAFAGSGTVVVDAGAVLGFGIGISGSLTFQVAAGATVRLHSGYFGSASGARFLNSGTVVIAPAPSVGFVDNFGENSVGSFVNEQGGTLVDPAGGASFGFEVPFENDGRVSVAAGQTLTFSDGGSADGSFNVAPKAKLEFGGGTFQLAQAKFSGLGTFDFQLGTIVLGGQKLANVAQCDTTQGPFTVTKSWVSALCISNGEAVMLGRSSTKFAHGVKATVGYGGYLLMGTRHRLSNLGSFVDGSDVCLAGGSVFTNSGVLQAVASKAGKAHVIHANCGLPGPEGKLVNARGAKIRATTATLDIFVPFVNHGRVSGRVHNQG
ncbi:MAG: hypothetical protein ACRDLT_03330 [Solirubrobacteraceae bacterium]